ncbi:hypothetical protein [Rhizobium sp. BR 314]|uniref:hypothetical protein n=1 Tax=Rhizobium sp. BR 314 TaxID=3040013 RepID=UPI0039BFC438
MKISDMPDAGYDNRGFEELDPKLVAAYPGVETRKKQKKRALPALVDLVPKGGPPGAHAASSSVVGPRTGEAEGIIPSQAGLKPCELLIPAA